MLNRVIPKPTRLNSESQKARVKLGLEVVDTLGDYRLEKLGPLQYYSSAPTGSNPGIEIRLHGMALTQEFSNVWCQVSVTVRLAPNKYN